MSKQPANMQLSSLFKDSKKKSEKRQFKEVKSSTDEVVAEDEGYGENFHFNQFINRYT